MPDIKHVKAGEQAAIALIKANNADGRTKDSSEHGQRISDGIRLEGISLQAEHAIVRKALMHIITKYHLEEDAELAEFIAYYEAVEAIKAQVREQENEHPGQ